VSRSRIQVSAAGQPVERCPTPAGGLHLTTIAVFGPLVGGEEVAV